MAAAKIRTQICAAHIEALADASWVLTDEWIDRHEQLCQKHDALADRILVQAIQSNAPLTTLLGIALATPPATWARDCQVYSIWNAVVATMDVGLLATCTRSGAKVHTMTLAVDRLALSRDPSVADIRQTVLNAHKNGCAFHLHVLEKILTCPYVVDRETLWPCVDLDLLWRKNTEDMEGAVLSFNTHIAPARTELFQRMSRECPDTLVYAGNVVVNAARAMLGTKPSMHHATSVQAFEITQLMDANAGLWPLLPPDVAKELQKKIRVKGLPMPALWAAARSKAQLTLAITVPASHQASRKM